MREGAWASVRAEHAADKPTHRLSVSRVYKRRGRLRCHRDGHVDRVVHFRPSKSTGAIFPKSRFPLPLRSWPFQLFNNLNVPRSFLMSLRPHDPDVEHGRFFENPAIEGTAAQRLFLMTFR